MTQVNIKVDIKPRTNTKKRGKRKQRRKIYTFLRFSVFSDYICPSPVKTWLHQDHKPHTKLPRGRLTSYITFTYAPNKGRNGNKKVSMASKVLVEIIGQKSLRYLPTICRILGDKNAFLLAPRSLPVSGENREATSPGQEEFPEIWMTKKPL